MVFHKPAKCVVKLDQTVLKLNVVIDTAVAQGTCAVILTLSIIAKQHDNINHFDSSVWWIVIQKFVMCNIMMFFMMKN